MDDKRLRRAVDEMLGALFSGSRVGILEDGDCTPLEFNGIGYSTGDNDMLAAELGAKHGKAFIFVQYLPAGMEHVRPPDGGYPKETEVNPRKIPPTDTWKVWPKTWAGQPVYYRRTGRVFAL